MPVNFDLNDLYAFRALLEYGNFRLAAESICLSQSALSRRIEKLEAALGTKLFDRTTRRVTPYPVWTDLCRPVRATACRRGVHAFGYR